eukprot:TRINITY_DN67393_c4_g2_i1.p1 TRINITY_DN67393_c4_g2~~TRINITY_DN67393_c4_g2_i1.p1  ORF type:complete len:457 (+),score=11.32 TRINITY_DN67393_c4_g2_i1:77-1447(+)
MSSDSPTPDCDGTGNTTTTQQIQVLQYPTATTPQSNWRQSIRFGLLVPLIAVAMVAAVSLVSAPLWVLQEQWSNHPAPYMSNGTRATQLAWDQKSTAQQIMFRVGSPVRFWAFNMSHLLTSFHSVSTLPHMKWLKLVRVIWGIFLLLVMVALTQVVGDNPIDGFAAALFLGSALNLTHLFVWSYIHAKHSTWSEGLKFASTLLLFFVAGVGIQGTLQILESKTLLTLIRVFVLAPLSSASSFWARRVLQRLDNIQQQEETEHRGYERGTAFVVVVGSYMYTASRLIALSTSTLSVVLVAIAVEICYLVWMVVLPERTKLIQKWKEFEVNQERVARSVTLDFYSDVLGTFIALACGISTTVNLFNGGATNVNTLSDVVTKMLLQLGISIVGQMTVLSVLLYRGAFTPHLLWAASDLRLKDQTSNERIRQAVLTLLVVGVVAWPSIELLQPITVVVAT